MPFQWTTTPSIQLGLLRAIAESHGFPTQTFHLGLEFAQRTGFELYEELSQTRRRMLGDWIFSNAAFGEEAPDRDARFLADFAADVAVQLGKDPAQPLSPVLARRNRLTLLRIRDEVVPAFLHAMMAEIEWGAFSVVGFSSVFQQTAASIALARRIKAAHPHVRIVFGGSNFDGDMGRELFRRLPCIDHAVLGEGDLAFPELLVAMAEGGDPRAIPGVASRDGGEVVFGGERPLFDDLDALPTPRYDEYFTRAEAIGLLAPSRIRETPIPFESARGCWWGAKHHCTFCGLNANGMRFRAKSPARVARELAELARAHGSTVFNGVDNIVDVGYLKTLFPTLIAQGKNYRLFYEIKSNLTRAEIKQLREAGVIVVQPGIESLSTHVLGLMRKGVTAAQNVNLLRWTRYYGIAAQWNVLWGFPGETKEDYLEQAKLARQLVHLAPPQSTGVRIRMDRFSPLYEDRDAFPADFRRADPSYAYVYPKSFDLEKIAYFFEYRLPDALEDGAYTALGQALQAWTDAWRGATKPTLTFSYSDDFLQIDDRRRGEHVVLTFEGPGARLYKAASERPVTAARAAELAGVSVPTATVGRGLGELVERGLMMRDGDKFLALALPATPGR